jgi:hypothetical protein
MAYVGLQVTGFRGRVEQPTAGPAEVQSVASGLNPGGEAVIPAEKTPTFTLSAARPRCPERVAWKMGGICAEIAGKRGNPQRASISLTF